MKKKFLCLALIAGMLMSGLTGCGSTSDDETDTVDTASTAKTATITLTAITGKSTTPEAIEQVQAAMNKITKSSLKTQVLLNLVTEDEYVAYIDSQVEKIEAELLAEEEAEAAAKAEAKAKKEAEKAANAQKKSRSKWTTTTTAETEETTGDEQEMTLDELGREVVKYPELEGTTLDIIFMTGIDMYKDFVEKEYLYSLNDELANNSKILSKYIYPSFLSACKDSGTVYAIPNNRMMGEYTYLLVDKTLADKYGLDTTKVKTLTDLEAFFDSVKQNETDVVPLSEAVDLNYVQYCTEEPSMIGAIIKSNYTTKSKAVPTNLLTNENYIAYNTLMDKLNAGNYIGGGEKYAVEVRTGYITTPEEENWEEDYYVIEYELPIADNDVMYSGMFAVSAYAKNPERCMEIITMLNTDAELRNIYAFGIEGVNYELNENGTVHMLNEDWSMDFYHCGNTLIGAVPEWLPANYAEIAKLQNVETIISPYFMWKYETKDNAELLAQYLEISEVYMDAFAKASDKTAYAESVTEEMAANEVLTKMLNAEESTGFLGSYVEFQQTAYPSGS